MRPRQCTLYSPHVSSLIPNHLHSRSRCDRSPLDAVAALLHSFTRTYTRTGLAQHVKPNKDKDHTCCSTLSSINSHHVAYFIPFPISDSYMYTYWLYLVWCRWQSIACCHFKERRYHSQSLTRSP